jgi:hypothetical protein
VLHQIGVGALGPVFRTYEPQRDRLVAVKVFRLDITPEQARALADELSRGADVGLFHPSIVEPIAAGVEGTVAYHAEEYVAAESLDVAMRHYAPAPVTTVLPYITQLAGAIDFARTVGVGHGALHPRDIFITPEEARAAGFGVVEALERVGLRAPVRRPYSPPERIAGSSWSTEADVFSLAAITYELLTGRRPAGIGREIGGLPPGAETLHAVLARAMDEDPGARFPTALGFAAALEAAAHGRIDEQAAASSSPGASELPLSPAGAIPPAAAVAHAAGGQADLHDEAADEDDIAPERDEDEAHHRLLLQEGEPTEFEAEREGEAPLEAEREGEAPLEEDIEAEAEADRYAGDDFLLDAAGVASAPDLDAADLRTRAEPVGGRMLDDDEVMVDQPPPPMFRPEDLRRQDSEPLPGRLGSHAAPRDRVQSSFGRTAPALGHSAGAADDAPPRRSRAALAAVLVLGVLGGLGAGYVLWGRTTPGGQAWSEGTVGPADSPPPRTDEPARAEAPPPVPVPADERPAAPAAPARDSEPVADPKPVATSGTLVVRSQPTGAGVTVNGRWRGRTPLTLDDLPFARYQVRVVQPGYGAGTEVVTLSANAPARSLSMRLRPEARAAAPARTPSTGPAAAGRAAPAGRPQSYTGSIYVDSRPRGARVFIDGQAVGATPLSVPDVPIGSHVVRLELPDHRIWSTTARVAAGQSARVTGSLERIQ